MTTEDDAEIEELLGPPSGGTIVRRSNKGGLQHLLLRSCPPGVLDGTQSIPLLAQHLDMTSQGIYRWIEKGRIPAKQARKVAAKSGGRTTFEEFVQYL